MQAENAAICPALPSLVLEMQPAVGFQLRDLTPINKGPFLQN